MRFLADNLPAGCGSPAEQQEVDGRWHSSRHIGGGKTQTALRAARRSPPKARETERQGAQNFGTRADANRPKGRGTFKTKGKCF